MLEASTPLRGVLIGAGYFAGIQAEAWQRISSANIVAVADPVPGRAAAFAARYGIARSYLDPEPMLATESPEFADIATRPDSHLALTMLAARHRAAVICQKPMAPTLAECEQMVQVCRQAGVRLIIHENWRWQPWYREIRRLLDQDRFGRVFHLGFRIRTGDGRGPEPYRVQPYFREMERLLIYETLVHFLDTFRYLGGEIEAVTCRTARINPIILGEDAAIIQAAFASGAQGLIDANRISGPNPPPVAFGEFRLEGERAMIRMTNEGHLFLADHGEPEVPHPYPIPAAGYKGDSVKAVQEHLVDCLRTGVQAESEGADYLQTVRLVLACYESATSGLPVNPQLCLPTS